MNENATATTPWNDHDGKVEIFQKVMKYLAEHPNEYTRCLDDKAGKEILIAACKDMTRPLEIPPGARVVFLPNEDNLRGEEPELDANTPILRSQSPSQVEVRAHCGGIPYNAGSSLIITLPPLGEIQHDPYNKDLLDYACSYIIW